MLALLNLNGCPMADPFLSQTVARPNAKTTPLEQLQLATEKKAAQMAAQRSASAGFDTSAPAYEVGYHSVGANGGFGQMGNTFASAAIPPRQVAQTYIPGPSSKPKSQDRLDSPALTAYGESPRPAPGVSAIERATAQPDLMSLFAGMMGRGSAGFTGNNTLPVDSSVPLNSGQPIGAPKASNAPIKVPAWLMNDPAPAAPKPALNVNANIAKFLNDSGASQAGNQANNFRNAVSGSGIRNADGSKSFS